MHINLMSANYTSQIVAPVRRRLVICSGFVVLLLLILIFIVFTD